MRSIRRGRSAKQGYVAWRAGGSYHLASVCVCVCRASALERGFVSCGRHGHSAQQVHLRAALSKRAWAGFLKFGRRWLSVCAVMSTCALARVFIMCQAREQR